MRRPAWTPASGDRADRTAPGARGLVASRMPRPVHRGRGRQRRRRKPGPASSAPSRTASRGPAGDRLRRQGRAGVPARPRPNLRGADTAEKRYLRGSRRRVVPERVKHPYSGEPDQSRTEGSSAWRRCSAGWISREGPRSSRGTGRARTRPGGAGRAAGNCGIPRNRPFIRRATSTAIAEARPASATNWRRDERCAPEVFWLDTALRVRTTVSANSACSTPTRAGRAGGVPRKTGSVKAARVQIRLGHPAVYAKPGFGARNYQTPLEYAYDNLKVPDLPPEALRSPEERQAMYAEEEATLDWLVGTFFPANAGSRFVSVATGQPGEAGLSDASHPGGTLGGGI